MRTGEHGLLALCANILDGCKQQLFYADLQKPREECRHRLSYERRTRWDLNIVSHFEVLSKEERRTQRLNRVTFEDLVCVRMRKKEFF